MDYEPEPEPRRGPPWTPWLWAVLGVGLAFVVGAVLVLALRDGDDGAVGTVTVVTRVEVPDVVGLEEAEARSVLRDAGLVVEVEREPSDESPGTVTGQSPEPGAVVAPGATVTIIVALEPETQTETVVQTVTEAETVTAEEPGTAVVPDVVGRDHAEAGADIEARGLVADSYPVPSDTERGTVVAQSPEPATDLPEGETVRLNVALGTDEREPLAVPDVTGALAPDARAIARREGFTVRTLYRDAPSPEEVGEVVLQEPDAGTTAPVLSQITIYVGR